MPAKLRRLKCFTGNLDGQRQGLVAAHSQAEARKVIETTRTDFDNYWHEISMQEPAASRPLVLFVRPIMSDVPWITYEEANYARDAH